MQLHKLGKYADPVLDRQLEELIRMLVKPTALTPPTVEPRYVGDECLDEATGIWYKSSGLTVADWHPLSGAGVSVPEAPIDGKIYVRRNGAWEELIIS